MKKAIKWFIEYGFEIVLILGFVAMIIYGLVNFIVFIILAKTLI